ncbi:MAG: GntG family PLP-dependent aldolase, partial [Planctomycetota bacterium]
MIDLRSDTLTRPTPSMRRCMADAEVGDDVFGEDPTVNRLERRVAEMLGKEAALFVPSGTMSNQIALRLHCRPGDSFMAESQCHILRYEQAAYAQLSGIASQPISTADQMLSVDYVKDQIHPDDVHCPQTRLVCLENTHNWGGGLALSLESAAELCHWAAEHALRRHLDGARLLNASIATGVAPADWALHFDTVSIC